MQAMKGNNQHEAVSVHSHIQQHVSEFMKVIETAEFMIGTKVVSISEWYEQVLDLLGLIHQNRKSIYFVGNGASCAMASHFAADLTKNAGIPSFSNNDGALITCFGNDFSFECVYSEILRRKMDDGDVLVAISSSGKSRNIVNALDFVRSTLPGNAIITFSGFSSDNPLRKNGTHNVYLNSSDYGMVESGHAYYMHMLIDLFIGIGIKKEK
jgi:phosphoheptose isomerase